MPIPAGTDLDHGGQTRQRSASGVTARGRAIRTHRACPCAPIRRLVVRGFVAGASCHGNFAPDVRFLRLSEYKGSGLLAVVIGGLGLC